MFDTQVVRVKNGQKPSGDAKIQGNHMRMQIQGDHMGFAPTGGTFCLSYPKLRYRHLLQC